VNGWVDDGLVGGFQAGEDLLIRQSMHCLLLHTHMNSSVCSFIDRLKDYGMPLIICCGCSEL